MNVHCQGCPSNLASLGEEFLDVPRQLGHTRIMPPSSNRAGGGTRAPIQV